MESELEYKDSSSVPSVKELQRALFPPKTSTSFFSNFLIKSSVFDEELEDAVQKQPSTRDLFTLNRETNFVPQAPRWPTECQVLDQKVNHISYTPSIPEPYYTPSGKEVQPKPTGEECGVIVYQYIPISAVNYFSRSSVGGSRYLLPACLCPEDNSLRFESRFESGNLARAIRVTQSYYELYLRADLYTNRHMQWFYFRVSNMRKNFLYRFSIVNFSKEDSLYNEGMRPLMYSTRNAQLHSIGWRRCGENITYYSNDNINENDPEAQMSYTLTFTMEFPHEDDEVYLANCYPYTYSDLEDYLEELSNHPIKTEFTTIRLLCKTPAGNNVHFVTITSPPTPGEIKKKRSVVLTARVHPGETPSSWLMKGFLDFLTSDCSVAKELREKFIFKLVPMLNPDGVIVGNNRCSLAAKDLNRQYRTVMRDTYPSIWYTKLMVRRLLEECGVAMYCDLHAHSRKHNIFIYGCENRRSSERKLQEQVFPLMLHKNTADKFSFESCKFRIQKAKEGTGRVVMWMMGIGNSYTMEASFAGSTLGTRADTHFSTVDFEQMAKSFCQTLHDYADDGPKKERLRVKIINRLVMEGSNADEPANIQLSDYSSDEGDTSSSSSNEVGRNDDGEDEVFVPVVPPPSPIVYKKFKPKVFHAKMKLLNNKSPNVARKPLPMCKATVSLCLSEKDSIFSDSSSDSENPVNNKGKPRRKCKKKKIKKRTNKKKDVGPYSDCEVHYRKSEKLRSVSVFDLVPPEKLRPQNCSKRSKTPIVRTEKKNTLLQQLSEVQAKLLLLKNKIWFGITPEVNEPLSWGCGNAPPKVSSSKPKKENKKRSPTKESKGKGDGKKAQFGLRRQTAIEWPNGTNRIRKSISLPDSLKVDNKNEDETTKATDLAKKKKKKKFVKKAKCVANAKVFFSKN